MHQQTSDRRPGSRHFPTASVMAMAAAMMMGMLDSAPVAAQLVNGSFEGAPQTSPYTIVSSGSYLDAAQTWKVTIGSVNVGTGPAGTRCLTTGTHCVDLNGNARGRIEQVMASVAGARCTVNFSMSRHVNLANGSATLKTLINNATTSPGTWVHGAPGVNANDGKWEPHSFSFITAGTSTTLAFESAIEGAAGPQVDDVAMTCIIPNPTGSLAVRKIVVNNTGGPAPIPPTFATTTHCSANAVSPSVNTLVAVPGSTTVTQPGQLATGIVCSVTETLPPPIPRLEACKGQGATWTASYSPPVTIVAGQTAVLTVTNTLTCNRPTGGTLQIHKSVVNTLGVPTPPSFTMVATCSGMSPVPVTVAVNGTVTVPPAGQIAGGTVCTITETIPPPMTGVKACPSGTASWVGSNPGPLTVQIAQTTGTIITNTLTCDKPPAGGHLTVYKVVVNSTGGAAPIPPTFNVMAHCTLGGASTLNVTLPVPANGGVSAAPPVALGSTCTITEAPLPSIANLPACKGATASWTSSFSGPVTITAGPAATLTATNTLRCNPSSPTGSLTVIKSVVNATGGPAPIPATFAMTVTCTPSGPTNQPVSVPPGSTGTTVSGIAAPSQCTVTETALAPIAHAEGCKGGSASWATAYSPAQPVQITAGGTTTVTVRNTLTCDKPVSTACLKYMPNNTACRLALMINRTKGPDTYAVTVSPAAITPTLNTAPSTASACVNAGGTTVYQTTCAFFYNSYPTAVTLTASSSAGALPAGFNWTGACSGSSATCVVNVTPSMPPSVVANFP